MFCAKFAKIRFSIQVVSEGKISKCLAKVPASTVVVMKGEMLMENRLRNVQIIVRVTAEERRFIDEKMKLVPTMNLSAYARKMLIDGYIINLDLPELKAHAAQLQKIGGNINQIVKRMNQTGSLYKSDVEEIKQLMAEVWKSERKLWFHFKGLAE